MIEIDVKGWLIFATIISIVLGFLFSARNGYRKFGDRYSNVILSGFLSIFVTTIPFLLYVVISMATSGWQKIFNSPEIAVAAFLVLLNCCNELCCSLSVKRNFPVDRMKMSLVSMWCLTWLCLSLTSIILIFQSDAVSWFVVTWQFFLLFVSIVTYFCSAAVVKLVEVGHVPGYRVPESRS
ncbi:hypothetical protein [Vibrio cholerae]|uniref:hypothetical protein n=1 Tax=Vibrio cholerae TaxID=666 RepID=UPI001C2FA20F